MSPPILLGPPELYQTPPPPPEVLARGPFMDLMVTNFNQTVAPPAPTIGKTEKGSSTYLSSGSPCLDLFFLATTQKNSLREKLDAAWNHNPLTTLKLICQLGGVRGYGKRDREGFLAAALWLHDHHPKSLACNLSTMAEFVCFKDLIEILFRLLKGFNAREIQRAIWLRVKNSSWKRKRRNGDGDGDDDCSALGFRTHDPFQRNKRKRGGKKKAGPTETRELRIENAKKRDLIDKESASEARKFDRAHKAKSLLDKYTTDPKFRYLYDRVTDLFAECLKQDVQKLKSGETMGISLAAKWCPSIASSFDRYLLLCEAIARKVFPKKEYPEYEGIEEEHYAYRVRDRLRKEVIVPLRKVLELPEVYISSKKWDSIPYNRVPSVAMNFYKEKFLRHDPKRFKKYLEAVRTGKNKKWKKVESEKEKEAKATPEPEASAMDLEVVKFNPAKIAAGALLPHEIIESLFDGDGGLVAEVQWQRMVDDLMQEGKLKNSLAVCDVCSNMSGVPIETSLALGVLVSELSEEPWKGKLITFSKDPKLQLVEGKNLMEKTQFVRRMGWGANTEFQGDRDLQKVFDLILQVAVDGKVKEDEMIKRVFVFSDMEFGQASTTSHRQHPNETDYQIIVRKFTDKGFANAIPQIVFWNVRNSGWSNKATPVTATQKGVVLVSGVSKNLMKLFLGGDDDGNINPVDAMEAAISTEEYKKLVVLD
ncbi:hypothetical protein Tsubulata_008768 [Turnera subulata]|uniref:Uncharacterized protein n=1 Tax=Turnera subulata TaxID=218843 RepID=A0A9Q0GCP7_9ROSI|nr:hypothetical protein Tsubulata_008768 [Turnera subulata]